MEPAELVSLRQEGDAARLTLRRPPLNFLNLELLRRIGSHLESFGDSPACKALILDSDLPAFSAGLEMSELTRDSIFLLLEEFHRVVRLLNSFVRPTIALVRGIALGAGSELLACCDFVFASEKAFFGQPEVKIGGIPSLAPLVLPPLIGARRASEMILTGNLVSAREAESIGLINRALPDSQISGAGDEIVKLLRGLSASVLEVALQSVRSARTHALEVHLREIESLYLNRLMSLEDPLEGVRAFLEKRQPVWKNK
jgi:cyclohexa-1,5-dienecarbonyl-CoA hydratase